MASGRVSNTRTPTTVLSEAETLLSDKVVVPQGQTPAIGGQFRPLQPRSLMLG
jgi:hypothetical protein